MKYRGILVYIIKSPATIILDCICSLEELWSKSYWRARHFGSIVPFCEIMTVLWTETTSQRSGWTHVVAWRWSIIIGRKFACTNYCVTCVETVCYNSQLVSPRVYELWSTSMSKEIETSKYLDPGKSWICEKVEIGIYLLCPPASGPLALRSGFWLLSLGLERLDLGCRDDDGWRSLSQIHKGRINPKQAVCQMKGEMPEMKDSKSIWESGWWF